jgi:hypothetical protein
VALVHFSRRLEEPSSFEGAHAWQDVMEIYSKPIVVSMVDSMTATNGSIAKYKDKVVGLSQIEGVANDVTLASGFSQDEEVDLVQVVLVAESFEVHERDSHVHKLMIAPHGLFPIP